VLTLVFISIDPPKVLFIGFLVYGLSGPVLFLARLRQRARRRTQGLGEFSDTKSLHDRDVPPR
jgi:CDP-diacylglycerol--serine O-phosphatidyltransferase